MMKKELYGFVCLCLGGCMSSMAFVEPSEFVDSRGYDFTLPFTSVVPDEPMPFLQTFKRAPHTFFSLVSREEKTDNGLVKRYFYQNESGQPTLYEGRRFAQAVEVFNKKGQCVKFEFQDEKGHPYENDVEPYSTVTFTYTEEGKLESKSFFRANGQVALVKFQDVDLTTEKEYSEAPDDQLPTFVFSKIEYCYDEAGKMKSAQLVNLANKKKRILEFSEVENTIKVESEETKQTFMYVFDNESRCVSEDYYHPCGLRDVIEKKKFDYSPEGVLQQIQLSTIENQQYREGKVFVLDEQGLLKRYTLVDECGRVTESATFDISEKRCFIKHDPNSKAFEVTFYFYNHLGQKMALEGVVGVKEHYNQLGYRTEIDMLDAEGKPLLNPDGVASWKYNLDNKGKIMNIQGFDVEGKELKISQESGAVISSESFESCEERK